MTSPIEESPLSILSVIDDVYGEDADIYHDVLGIPPTASVKTIKKAFLERRSELLHMPEALRVEEEQDDISVSHLIEAERKLDALLMAAHILADRNLRDVYDRRELPYRGKLVDVVLAPRKEVEPHPRTGGRGFFKVRSFGKKRSSLKKNLASADLESTSEAPTPPTNASHDSSSDGSSKVWEEPVEMHRVTSTTATIGVHRTAPSSNWSGSKPRRNRPRLVASISSSSSDASSDRQKWQQQTKKSRSAVPYLFRDSNSTAPPLSTGQSTMQQHRRQRSVSFNERVQEATPILNRSTEDDDESLTIDPSVYSVYSEGDWEDDEPPSCIDRYVVSRGYIQKMKEEVVGALEDTNRSFSQVMNAFTLTDEDVEAVTGRISKANQQFRKDVKPIRLPKVLPSCV